MTGGSLNQPFRLCAVLAALTTLLSALAIAVAHAPNGMALVWLGSAPAAALLCGQPMRRWPGLLAAQYAGILAGALIAGAPHINLVSLAPFNMVEAALAAWLLRRTATAEEALSTPWSIGRFVVLAVLLAPALTAIGAGFSHWLITGEPWSEPALRWPISHGLGMMVGFPLALKVLRGRLTLAEIAKRGGPLQLGLTIALVLATAFLAFAQHYFPLLYLPIVPLLFATLTYGRVGATLGLAAVVIGGGSARLMFGPLPFLDHLSGFGQLEYAAVYLSALFACALPVAAAIEQRELLRRRLVRSEAHFRALAEASSDAFVTLTSDGRIRYASNALQHLTGHVPAELRNYPGEVLIHPDHRARVGAVLRAALEQPDRTVRIDYLALGTTGGTVWLESMFSAFQDPSDPDTAILCVSRDLSERKRREDELRRAADTDTLTALPNRAAFRRAVEASVRRGETGTLALLDLDHFKNINDRHGHAAGDAALRAVAALLRDTVRGEDVVARYGGEEFAILFPRLTLAEAQHAADRLGERLASTMIDVGETRLFLTASIGLSALAPGRPIDDALTEALGRADASLYAAKRAGRNRVMAAA